MFKWPTTILFEFLMRRDFRSLFEIWSINSLLTSVDVRESSKSLYTFLLVTGSQIELFLIKLTKFSFLMNTKALAIKKHSKLGLKIEKNFFAVC